MLELRQIKKSYHHKLVFEGVDIHVREGELVLLVGKSGMGKSTFLDIVAGIREYDQGEYFYNGNRIDPTDDRAMSWFRNKHIGYILQDFALLEDYTVIDNLLLPIRYSQRKDSLSIENRARQLATTFGLLDILDKKAKSISGGQKQRVAIVRSILLDPAIVLADEPTSHLDADNAELVLQFFKELKQQGKIILLATHDERFRSIADSIYTFETAMAKVEG